MHTPTAAHTIAALSIDCPTCPARRLTPCRTRDGRPAHTRRTAAGLRRALRDDHRQHVRAVGAQQRVDAGRPAAGDHTAAMACPCSDCGDWLADCITSDGWPA